MTKELDNLKRAIIRLKIDLQAEGHRPWDGKSKRLQNFITWERRPSEITKFKTKLPIRLRAKVILAAPVVRFDVRKLKTAQRNVIKKNLLHFYNNPELAACKIPHKHYGEIYPIVARCRRGYFLYDGNHRANYNLLAGKIHKAHLIDLRDIDNLIYQLKRKKAA